MTVMRNLEQERVQYAFKCANDGCNEKDDNEKYRSFKAKDYKSYARRIPTLIKVNGIAATFAFVKAKANGGKKEYDLIYKQTCEWLEKTTYDIMNFNSKKDFCELLIQLDSSNYRMVTAEVLSLFKWIGRFAEGMVKGDEDDEQ